MNEKIQEVGRQALSIDEVSSSSGLGRTKIYEAIASGSLKARKCGKRTIVLTDDLRAFLSALPPAIQPKESSENLPAITPQKNPEIEGVPSQRKADELCSGRSVPYSGKVRAR